MLSFLQGKYNAHPSVKDFRKGNTFSENRIFHKSKNLMMSFTTIIMILAVEIIPTS